VYFACKALGRAEEVDPICKACEKQEGYLLLRLLGRR